MRLPFTLDPQIIHHVIYNQAGSIGKAIIELIMNSIDAGATGVDIAMTQEGFVCSDDGRGFQSWEEVELYFGKFGTPHQEGDATYGRFRLGRGQIMAHAKTTWQSNSWQMQVDTKTMGYSYDLEELTQPQSGCQITGQWYEQLSSTELLSAQQEIRDLVRYTPIAVKLNGRVISKDPKNERWDHEDDVAYYRAKPEGAVSIYNQGVLVRHDPSQAWGAGGMIVTKKAIDLNVSRTEILRKTCPVWKVIAPQFRKLAEDVAVRLGDNRKTEARRERCAQAMLSGDPKSHEMYWREEVITILPGKRHVTLQNFLHRTRHSAKTPNRFTVVTNSFDTPKGESIARAEVTTVVHPVTLERFGCYDVEDFEDALQRAMDNIAAVAKVAINTHDLPKALDFESIRDAFVERTCIVSEKQELDKETRRAWTAMRWCIQNYAGLCAGGERYGRGRLKWNSPYKMEILLGDSNTAEAWTDGKTYIAFDKKIVSRLKSEPIKTATYLFALTEHEVAHNGDSIECGHDETFYQRFHDITVKMSATRAQYMHLFLAKLNMSMANEGKPKDNYKAWHEMRLAEQVGDGREKRGLQREMPDLVSHYVVTQDPAPENPSFIEAVNRSLTEAGICPPPPDWSELAKKARERQERLNEQNAESKRQEKQLREDLDREHQAHLEAMEAFDNEEMQRIADALCIPREEVKSYMLPWLEGLQAEDLRIQWEAAHWNDQDVDEGEYFGEDEDHHEQGVREDRAVSELERLKTVVGSELAAAIEPEETAWTLRRNAAAAGFLDVRDYLAWRSSGK